MTNASASKRKRTRPAGSGGASPGRSSTTTWVAIGGVVVVLVLAAMLLSGGEDPGGFTQAAVGEVSIDRDATTTLEPGEMVPAFTAPSLAGGGTLAWEDLVGRPTILAIWAPWCPHCQVELPRLAAAVDARPDLQLVTITTAYGAQPGPTPQEYLDDEGLSFPVAVDDVEGTLSSGFGVQGFPTTYFVDASGAVTQVTSGEIEAAQLDAILTDLLSR